MEERGREEEEEKEEEEEGRTRRSSVKAAGNTAPLSVVIWLLL